MGLTTNIIISLLFVIIFIYFDIRHKPHFLRMEQKEGWKTTLPIYKVYCPDHGWFEDHLHGWELATYFSCPQCTKEDLRHMHEV